VDAANSALSVAKSKATQAAEVLSAAQEKSADAKAAYEAATERLASAQSAASAAKQKAGAANAKLEQAKNAYTDLKSRADTRDAANKALADAKAALKQAEADLASAEAAVPGLERQAEQYGDVAAILAKLLGADEYLANPDVLLAAKDELVAYGASDGLTQATKDALSRYEQLLDDAYRLATEASALDPVIQLDQEAANAADAQLASAKADCELQQQIEEQLRQAAAARESSAGQANSVRVGRATYVPEHMATLGTPSTGDERNPYLPLGVAGVGSLAVFAGGRRRRRED
jgi:predicted  nucleic acid-binding Zn-ribbon protein